MRVANRDFALTTSALRAWQKVKGTVRVRANVRGAKTHGVGLYVDGRVVSRDRSAPYTVRWNSRKVHDGRHWITLAAVASDGRVAKRRLPLVVTNHVVTKPKPKPKRKLKSEPELKPRLKPVAESVQLIERNYFEEIEFGDTSRLVDMIDLTQDMVSCSLPCNDMAN